MAKTKIKKKKTPVGTVTWFDLTVKNAGKVRKFYEQIAGWSSEPLDMGGYDDYCMQPPGSGKTVAGICHARGQNTGLPPQWLIYITVADLDASVRKCRQHGGKVLRPPRALGGGRMAVVSDPAGAVAALFEP